MIVGESLKDSIRSHHDLEKDACKYHKKACKVSMCAYTMLIRMDSKLFSENLPLFKNGHNSKN